MWKARNKALEGNGLDVLRIILCALFCLTSSRVAMGAAPQGGELVHVWYRSTPGCPDGEAFLVRLARLGRVAALAAVGDRVDFVVTLAATPASSSGRLERQSASGAVAIREITAAACADVADGLALSLDLAMDPEAVAREAREHDDGESLREPRASDRPSALWRAHVGAQGSVETGPAGATLPGLALFAAVDASEHVFSARLSARGARGATRTSVPLNVTLLAARGEACATPWGATTAWAIAACLGLEAGLLIADSADERGQVDQGLWVSGAGHLRLGWDAGLGIVLEAQLGVNVPFVQYRLRSQQGVLLAEGDPIGLAAALGAGFML